jgi:hypothetical protein
MSTHLMRPKMITKIKMPARNDGSRVPNPYRYLCAHGHLHPSDRAAAKCNQKHRLEGK